MYRKIGCLFAVALFAGPAFAQDQGNSAASAAPAATSTPADPAVATAVAQAAQAAPAVPAEDPVVCRAQAVTGSRLGTRRVCAKQSEWDRRRLHDNQQMDKLQNTGHYSVGH